MSTDICMCCYSGLAVKELGLSDQIGTYLPKNKVSGLW